MFSSCSPLSGWLLYCKTLGLRSWRKWSRRRCCQSDASRIGTPPSSCPAKHTHEPGWDLLSGNPAKHKGWEEPSSCPDAMVWVTVALFRAIWIVINMICTHWSLASFHLSQIIPPTGVSLFFLVIKRFPAANKWTVHTKVGHFKAFFFFSPWDLFFFFSANFDRIPDVPPAVPLGPSPGGACTCFGIQRCFPVVQPFWSRKALKSVVLMQQQLQYLYLNNNKKPRKQSQFVTNERCHLGNSNLNDPHEMRLIQVLLEKLPSSRKSYT